MTTNFKTSVLRESVVSLDASILHIWYFYFPRLATDSVFIKPGTRPRQQYGRSISNVKICVPTWNETSCFYKWLLMSLEGNFLSPTSSLFPPVETWRSHSPQCLLCAIWSLSCVPPASKMPAEQFRVQGGSCSHSICGAFNPEVLSRSSQGGRLSNSTQIHRRPTLSCCPLAVLTCLLFIIPSLNKAI